MNTMTTCYHRDTSKRKCLVHEGNDISFCLDCGGVVHIRAHLGAQELEKDRAREVIMKLMCDSGLWTYTQLPNGDLYGEIPETHPAWVSADGAAAEYNRYSESVGVRSVWDDVPDETRRAFRLKVINLRWKQMKAGHVPDGIVIQSSEVD